LGFNNGPAGVLRTVFECIASGLLLPDGPGVYDPCEKEPTDAAGDMTIQQREDITAYAQAAVRMMIFRQVYRLLDVEELPKLTPRWKQKRTRNEIQEVAAGSIVAEENVEVNVKKAKEDDPAEVQ
jgi:zinc finger RNA-binding protein